MSINLTVPDNTNAPPLKPKLTVIGVGGAGGNAVNNMIRSELEGVDFVVANTDAQALEQSRTERRIQLGVNITQGLGAGSRPEVGRAAAEEAIEEILAELDGAHMAFIAAGMGGGTGTGGAPVIASAAKDRGILTVGVVTKPFMFEGTHRMAQAEAGIEELEQYVDTLIVIPNQNLFRIANEQTTFAEAFKMADEVLYSGVRGVTDLMVMPGLINLDFADIRTVMSEMGKAMMGTGEAEGERRALDAAEAAIANPLLDDTSMKGAKGVLINITGGMDITLFEVDEAANRIRAEVDPDAYIIVGSAFDPGLEGTMRVSVVATGIDADASEMPLPTMLHLAERLEQGEDYGSAALRKAEQAAEAETLAVDEPAAEEEAAEEETAEAAEPAAEADPSDEITAPAAAGELPVESASESEPELAPGPLPAAMPSMGATDAFIPPEPAATGNGADGDGADSETAGEPAEDDGESAAEAAEETAKLSARSLGASLFERVTSTGRAAFGKKKRIPEEAPEVAENKELSAIDETAIPAPEAAEDGNVTNLEEGGGEEGEGKLGGLDPADRLPSSEHEEDLLDIPAFLRRQAN